MAESRDKFNFFVEAHFEKGKVDEGQPELLVEGVCSTDTEDADEETLIPDGFILDYFLTDGFINWNHRSKDDPSAYIGEPLEAKIIDNGKKMYVKGFLYPDSKKARSTYELGVTLEKSKSTRRLGWSIEGFALERDPFNNKRVTKAIITGVAITACPKNFNTFVSIVKGHADELFIPLEKEEELDEAEKAMMAGQLTGTDTHNQALTVEPLKVEDLEKTSKPLTKAQVVHSFLKQHPGQTPKQCELYYTLVDRVRQLTNTMVISDETLEKANQLLDNETAIEKAFWLLKNVDALEKGKTSKALAQPEEDEQAGQVDPTAEGGVESDPQQAAPVEDPVAASQPEADDMPAEDEDIDKMAKAMAGDCADEDDMAEKLIRKGFGIKKAMDTATSVMASYREQQNGDAMPSGITKLVKGELQKSQQYTDALVKGLRDDLVTSLAGVKEVYDAIKVKLSVLDNMTSLEKSMQASFLETLDQRLTPLTQKLEELSNQPLARKSLTSQAQGIERFAKSQDAPVSDGKVLDINKKADRRKAVDLMLSVAKDNIIKGLDDRELEHEIKVVEIGANISPKGLMALKTLGYSIKEENVA